MCFCRDWDLWGPLILCLTLGILLSVNVSAISPSHFHLPITEVGHVQAPKAHSLGVFTSVVVIVCVGALVVTIQAKASTCPCCIFDSSSQSYTASASRWQGVCTHSSLDGFLF